MRYECAVPTKLSRDAWRAMANVEGFAEGASIFGSDDDPAYFVNGTQVSNLVDDDVALRLTRKVISRQRARLKEDPRVELRGSSDWIGISLGKRADIAFVVELAELAAEAHRPLDGATAKPPPTGAELARRRRFH